MKSIFTIIYIFLFNFLSAQSWQQMGDTHFESVRDFYFDSIDNSLYIGGHFRNFNDTIDARGLVKWDGENFSPVGTFPNSGCNQFNCAPVRSIYRFQNEIYTSVISAGFDSQNQGQIIGLARWNGMQWDSVGGGVRHSVYDQIVYNNELYVMGVFDEAGGLPAKSISKWDGENWHDLNFPYFHNPNQNISIFSSAVYNNELYVVGNFRNEDSSVRDVAKYDGENWLPVGGGIKGGWDDVGDIVVYQDEIYICGDFKVSSGNAGNKIMKLKNGEWTDVGGGLDSNLDIAHKMLVWDDLLYVFGIFDSVGNGLPANNIAIWDGEKWCGSTISINGKIVDAIIYDDELWIMGGFNNIGSQVIHNIAKWDGGHLNDTCQLVNSTNNSITEISDKLTIFPNPTTSKIHINLEGIPISTKLVSTIIDAYGKTVAEYKFNSSDTKTINVEHLPSGIYFLKIETENQIFSKKFVKQ